MNFNSDKKITMYRGNKKTPKESVRIFQCEIQTYKGAGYVLKKPKVNTEPVTQEVQTAT